MLFDRNSKIFYAYNDGGLVRYMSESKELVYQYISKRWKNQEDINKRLITLRLPEQDAYYQAEYAEWVSNDEGDEKFIPYYGNICILSTKSKENLEDLYRNNKGMFCRQNQTYELQSSEKTLYMLIKGRGEDAYVLETISTIED
jgi:hypothetical protein